MRIKFENIKPQENILWVEPEVMIPIDKNVFSISCKVKDRYSGKTYLKECIYSTKKEAERKRLVWNKILDREK